MTEKEVSSYWRGRREGYTLKSLHWALKTEKQFAKWRRWEKETILAEAPPQMETQRFRTSRDMSSLRRVVKEVPGTKLSFPI